MNPRTLTRAASLLLCSLLTSSALAEDTPDPLATILKSSHVRQGTMEEHDRAHPNSPGATIVKEDGLVETITVLEGLVETKKAFRLSGTKTPKAYNAVSCGEHKKITLTNVAIASDGPALRVFGKCSVTLVNSFIVSRSGPAILIEGKKASVTLDHCTVVGTKAKGKTLAARVGRRSKLHAKKTLFKGAVAFSRKRDFKKSGVTIDVPADEVKKRKKKSRKRRKRRKK